MTGRTFENRKAYDKRFRIFVSKMTKVGGYEPRCQYLYPIMDGVPFKDLEVALDMATLEQDTQQRLKK